MVTIQLTKDEFITLLIACEDHERSLNVRATFSAGQEEGGLAGNDLIEIRMLLQKLRGIGDKAYGPHGYSTSQDLL